MARDPLRCPGCGAMAQERPDPDGGVQCAFCGVRFFTHSGALATGARSHRSPLLLGVALLSLLALGALIWQIQRQPAAAHRGPADPAAHTPLSPGAAAEGPLSATFAFHTRRPSVETSFMIYGEATNTSAQPIRAVEVVAVLRDAAGAEVMTYSGYSIDDSVAPKASSPVRILIKDPPTHAAIDFEVFARPLSVQRPQAEELRVEANAPADQSVFRRVSGLVHNDGSAPVKLVKVTFVGRDAAGKIVGIGEAFAKDREIPAGGASRWDALASFGGAAATVDYRVSGWPVSTE